MAWWVGLTLLVSTQSTGIELNLHDTWDRLLPVHEYPNASTSRWSDARARATANPNPIQGPGMGLGQPDWMYVTLSVYALFYPFPSSPDMIALSCPYGVGQD